MKNAYEVRGDVTAIFLKRRDGTTIETLIDSEDLPRMNDYPNAWYPSWSSGASSYYVYGNYPKVNGKQPKAKLHRLLMRNPVGMPIDHINHDTLDNRKSNLRIVTHTENVQNVGANKQNKSEIRGVSWHKGFGKWQARLTVNGKERTVGYFDSLKEAGTEVAKARAKYMQGSKEYLETSDKDALDVRFGLGDRPTQKSRTGIRGVGWHKHTGKWRARIQVGNDCISLGYYDDINEAAKAVEEARTKYEVKSPI